MVVTNAITESTAAWGGFPSQARLPDVMGFWAFSVCWAVKSKESKANFR